MQLVTFSANAKDTKIGIRHGDMIVDMPAALEHVLQDSSGPDADRAIEMVSGAMLDFVRRGEEGLEQVRRVAEFLQETRQEDLGKLCSPSGERIAYSSKDVSLHKPLDVFRALNIGANYNAYLAMMRFIEPYEGTAETFWKLPQALIGPNESILWPTSSQQISCEMELGVIIGRQGKRITREQALDYVFGYTVVNDVTAIDLFTRGLGEGREGLPGFYYLALAKSMDTFEAIGPGITLKDEIADPQDLEAEFRVNGELKVRGSTSDMRLGVAELIEYISQDITLYPGDLIATGAMATAAYAPQVRMQIGDRIEMEIDRIGVLRNNVRK